MTQWWPKQITLRDTLLTFQHVNLTCALIPIFVSSEAHSSSIWQTQPSLCRLQNSFNPGSIVALAQPLAPWETGPYSTYELFSFSLLPKAPFLSSITNTGKAVVEDINDCSPDKSSAINLGLTLLDPNESSRACPFLVILSPFSFQEDLGLFLQVHPDYFHSSSQLTYPFNTYSLNMQVLSHLCLFLPSLLFLTSSLQSVPYPPWEASICTILPSQPTYVWAQTPNLRNME